ncbi:MAG: 4Fe-4S binding protein [Deltaproteobacteria bacterium]|nr:4Fe-4S binding protein [Deltaproteobacteria bacterium]
MTHSPNVGVILCRCRGEIGDRVNLGELRKTLGSEKGVAFIRTAESLCDDPRPLRVKGVTALVVAGCREGTPMERSKIVLEGRPEPLGACEFVDLKTPLSHSPCDPATSTAYAGLLIGAYVEKARAAGKAPAGTAYTALGWLIRRPGASMSRRGFLRLPWKIARNEPHREEIPWIDPNRCLAPATPCRECSSACPFQAISIREDRPFLVEGRCEECGLCTTVCPVDALLMPSFSYARSLGLLDALANPAIDIGRRVILFACDRGNDVLGPVVQEVWARGSTPLVLRVPCLAALSPLLMVRSMELGFEEIVPFCPDLRCSKRPSLSLWEKRIRTLLNCLGSLDSTGSPTPIRFPGHGPFQSSSLIGERSRPSRGRRPTPTPLSGDPRIDLIRMLSSLIEPGDHREIPLEGTGLPYGDILIDKDRCTLCGACSRHCPTGALRLEEGPETAIRFSHFACLACGRCLAQCSEKAVSLRRVVQTHRFRKDALVVKMHDEPARCRICGRITGKKRLQERVALQLRDAGFDRLADGIGLCRLCKNRAVYQESDDLAEGPEVSSIA